MAKKVLQCLYSLGIGGAETMVINLDKSLNGTDVTFDYLVNKRLDNGYESIVRQRGGKIIYVQPVSMHKSTLAYINNIKEKIAENGPYEAVHIHTDAMGFLPALAAKFAGVKRIICHAHTTKYDNRISIRERVGLFCHRFFVKYLHVICLACGDGAGKSVYGKRKFFVINNAIRVKDYINVNNEEIIRTRKELLAEGKKVVMHIGRFDEAKNQAFIVELAEKVKENKEILFVLVGDGILFEYIKGIVSTDNIRLLGIRNDIPLLLNVADVFIMPSVYEGIPVSLIEAQAAGLPCIVSTGVPKQVNQGVNEFSFIPLDMTMWNDELLRMLNKKKTDLPTAAKIIRKNGFDVETNIDELLNYYGIG